MVDILSQRLRYITLWYLVANVFRLRIEVVGLVERVNSSGFVLVQTELDERHRAVREGIVVRAEALVLNAVVAAYRKAERILKVVHSVDGVVFRVRRVVFDEVALEGGAVLREEGSDAEFGLREGVQLDSDDQDLEDLKNQLPRHSPSLSIFHLFERIHEMKLQLLSHLLDFVWLCCGRFCRGTFLRRIQL